MSLSALKLAAVLNNQRTHKPVPLLTTKKKEIVMDFVQDGRYYALMAEQGRFVCQCNDPLLAACIYLEDQEVVIALEILRHIDRDYCLKTLKAILHK